MSEGWKERARLNAELARCLDEESVELVGAIAAGDEAGLARLASMSRGEVDALFETAKFLLCELAGATHAIQDRKVQLELGL